MPAFCNASAVSVGTLIGQSDSIRCNHGCPGQEIGSTQIHCKDLGVTADWSVVAKAATCDSLSVYFYRSCSPTALPGEETQL